MVGRRGDAALGGEQGVEVADEGGEDVEEGVVEVVHELVDLLVLHLAHALRRQVVGQLSALLLAEHGGAEGIHLLHVGRAEGEEAADVDLLDAVTVGEEAVALVQFGDGLSQLLVQRGELLVQLRQVLVGLVEALAGCGQALHLQEHIDHGHGQQQGEDAHKDERPAQLAVLLVGHELVVVVDHGEDAHALQVAQRGVVEAEAVLRGAYEAVGPLHVALAGQQVGQRPERCLVLDGVAHVANGGAQQPVFLLLVVAHVAIDPGAEEGHLGELRRSGVYTAHLLVVPAEGLVVASLVAGVGLLQEEIGQAGGVEELLALQLLAVVAGALAVVGIDGRVLRVVACLAIDIAADFVVETAQAVTEGLLADRLHELHGFEVGTGLGIEAGFAQLHGGHLALGAGGTGQLQATVEVAAGRVVAVLIVGLYQLVVQAHRLGSVAMCTTSLGLQGIDAALVGSVVFGYAADG